MKVRDLIDFLNQFDTDEKIEIEVYESVPGKYVDSTYSIANNDVQ